MPPTIAKDTTTLEWEQLQQNMGALHKQSYEDIMLLLVPASGMMDEATPRDRHKGLANRRTILERLQLTVNKVEHMQTRKLWSYQSLVYHHATQAFYRVVTVYHKQGGRWLIADCDQEEKTRLKKMQAMANSTYKVTIEAVELSSSTNPEHPETPQWELSPKVTGRCLTVFTGDCRILQGEHLISRDMPRVPESPLDKEAILGLHNNLRIILSRELAQEGWDQDCCRIGMITACLHLMRAQAGRATRDAAWACKEELKIALRSKVQEHALLGLEIKRAWMNQPWHTAKPEKPKSE